MAAVPDLKAEVTYPTFPTRLTAARKTATKRETSSLSAAGLIVAEVAFVISSCYQIRTIAKERHSFPAYGVYRVYTQINTIRKYNQKRTDRTLYTSEG